MSQQLTPYQSFEMELARRHEEIGRILPSHIDPKRFENVALIAIKNNPQLLAADRRSLHQAMTEAAEDGLHPDSREGVITVFKEKQRDGSYVQVANWNPMLYGIRKRALELCGIIIEAHVVYERDSFVLRQGDNPSLEHIPPALGSDRGNPVGAYAIFRRGADVLHREIMSKQEIEVVKQQSRQQGGLMWTKFWTEAWKKTVIRRGIKTLPSIPALEQVISREDRDFSFDRKGAVAAEEIPSPPPPAAEPIPLEAEEMIAEAPEGPPEPQGAPLAAKSPPPVETPPPVKTPPPVETPPPEQSPLLAQYKAAMEAADGVRALSGVWEMFEKKLKGADRQVATAIFEQRYEVLSNGS